MTFQATDSALPRAHAGPRITIHNLLNPAVAIFVFCGGIAFFEPSPYDFASLVAIPLWFIAGFRIHRSFVVFATLMLVYNIAGFISLIPYWNEPDPVMFMLQSVYLLITTLFFALYFGERTPERGELVLKAFTASTVMAAGAAILGYFDIAGLSSVFMNWDRATGTFKDPNVLGSYQIMGALYCMQLLTLKRTRHILGTTATFLVIMTGVFLSFSRGSWLALAIASVMTLGFAFVTTNNPRVRLRIVVIAACGLGVLIVALIALMSVDGVRDLLIQRLQGVGEEYDDRRFFNQLRSLPMLLDLPLGMGPLRFRLIFGLEPHSSFVNAFASYGWLGGFAFLILMGATVVVGIRLCLKPSPVRTLAQVFVPSLFAFILQGFQIDIDHWRHVFLMLGAVWGLEAARQRSLVQLGAGDQLPWTTAAAKP